MSKFIVIDRDTAYLLPPSLQDWLSEDHLARFVVEVIDQLDLSGMVAQYAGRGSKAHHPATLVALLVYGYATGVFSSRKIERQSYDSVAFRFIAAGSHPDHDTIATFRRRFLAEIEALFMQVLELAQEMKLLKLGTVCLDGTKIHANASKHSALSHGHIERIEAQLRAEVQELLALAEAADKSDVPEGVVLPDEIKRREDRIHVMAAAKDKIALRAAERHQREKQDFDEKIAAREAKQAQSGKRPGGKAPRAPEPGPSVADQVNLTDEDSRIMPLSGGGFEQAYNAQAALDAETMLVVATRLTQAPNDKEQVLPMLELLSQPSLPAGAGTIATLIADTGYCSQANIKACEAAGIEPLIAVARQAHHPDWRERFSEPQRLSPDASVVETMAHKLKTKAGRTRYALRKQTVEPVFGIIKSVMGFRQFLLRGIDQARAEWSLVCMAWNLKRMAVLRRKTALSP